MGNNGTVSLSKNAFFPGEIVEVSLNKPSSEIRGTSIGIYISGLPFKDIGAEWTKQAEFDVSSNARFQAPTASGYYALAIDNGTEPDIVGIFTVMPTPMETLKKGIFVLALGVAAGALIATAIGRYIASKK